MAFTYEALAAELTGDPAGLGYAGKTDQQAADLLNSTSTGRTLDRGVIETWRLYERLDATELKGLTNGNRTRLGAILGLGTLNANSPIIAGDISDIFGAGSSTVKNLTGHAAGAFPGDDLRTSKISRAEELGWPSPSANDVAIARSL